MIIEVRMIRPGVLVNQVRAAVDRELGDMPRDKERGRRRRDLFAETMEFAERWFDHRLCEGGDAVVLILDTEAKTCTVKEKSK